MREKLQSAIQNLSKASVLVIGDLAIDEMTYGSTSRLSREAPVIILNHDHTDIILGAAGNAAHNIAALGARRSGIIAVTGKDYHCSLLLDAMERDQVDTSGLVQDVDRPTTTKTRISGIANHSVTQQIIRIDRESTHALSPRVENEILDKISALAPQFDALLLSDYGLGVLTETVIEHCRNLAQKHRLIITADSHRDLTLFKGASVITPNQPEAENNVGYPLNTLDEVLRGGRELQSKTDVENVLITRGGEGMVLFQQNEDPNREGSYAEIPVFNKSEVFDVTGAGDTVIGTLTLALASGTGILEASVLGNLAASIVVRRFGASTTNPTELTEALLEVDEKKITGILQKQPC